MKTTRNGNGTSQGNGIPAQSTAAASASFLSESLTFASSEPLSQMNRDTMHLCNNSTAPKSSEPLSQMNRDTILGLIAQMRDLLSLICYYSENK